ncbi:MAG: citrate transporter [Phascolarctobacterium sp.]|nr:citrate transporter [Phascolarctobacterium sp.]
MDKFKELIKKDIVLVTAVLLAAVSSIFHRPQLSYIDFGVLSILLSLMLVVAGLKSIRFLDWIAVELLNRCQGERQIALALVGITYISSMFVTNDVALLTFVPLALVIGKTLKLDMARIIILQTLAANLGSMFTPPGNPQNLFLFAHYGYTAIGFFKVMAIPTVLSIVLLLILLYRGRNRNLNLELPDLPKPEKVATYLYLGLLLLNIAAVLHVFDKYIALVVTTVAIIGMKKGLFKEVDYSLLITFVGFFLFIGNISETEFVTYLQQSFLGSASGTYLAGIVASQFISNVPAAMLLAGLTKEADALLLGVNIGGLGTLIASMASVISYKLFCKEQPWLGGQYLRMFLYYNFAGLLLIGGLTYFIVLF